MSITAITVTHNSAYVIKNMLACIAGHPQITHYIMVDNGSDDDTVAQVRRAYADVELIENQTNEGFGRACNRALANVQTEYALLINPDVTLDHADIDTLLQLMGENPQAAIAGVALTGSAMDKQHSVPLLSGALMLWRMQHMQQVSFFDPALFLFYEDDDICLRTKKAGYELLLCDETSVQHQPGMSCKLNPELMELKLRSLVWSSLYVLKKHSGACAAWLKAQRIIIAQRLACAFKPDATKATERAIRIEAAKAFLRNPERFEPYG